MHQKEPRSCWNTPLTIPQRSKCLSASVSCSRFASPPLPGRPLKYGGESSSFSITQSLFLPRWRATESSALTAGLPYSPYPWPCSQMLHVLMDERPERIRDFLWRFSAPCSPIVGAGCALWECASAHSCSSGSQLTTRLESVQRELCRGNRRIEPIHQNTEMNEKKTSRGQSQSLESLFSLNYSMILV